MPISPPIRSFISKDHASKANHGSHSPGPLGYKVGDGLGVTLTGTGHPNSPRYTMRPRLAGYKPPGTVSATGSVSDQPGPGTYNAMSSIGTQSHSARGTAASFSFGTSERHRPETHPKKTMYIGKDYERQNWGTNSPGPAMYDTKYTIGPSAPPQYKAAPAFTFNTESRFAY